MKYLTGASNAAFRLKFASPWVKRAAHLPQASHEWHELLTALEAEGRNDSMSVENGSEAEGRVWAFIYLPDLAQWKAAGWLSAAVSRDGVTWAVSGACTCRMISRRDEPPEFVAMHEYLPLWLAEALGITRRAPLPLK